MIHSNIQCVVSCAVVRIPDSDLDGLDLAKGGLRDCLKLKELHPVLSKIGSNHSRDWPRLVR